MWGSQFNKLAQVSARFCGTWQAFTIAFALVSIWAVSGLYFGYSDQLYQLTINTGTTVVTFLMVFLLQNTQNRDSAAIQLKLDELIRVSNASNELMGAEQLTDQELATLGKQTRSSVSLTG